MVQAPGTGYCTEGGTAHGRRLGRIYARATLDYNDAGLGLAISDNPIGTNATIDKWAGTMHEMRSWDQILSCGGGGAG